MEASQTIHRTLGFTSVRDGSHGREYQILRSPERGLPPPHSPNLQFIPHQTATGSLSIPGTFERRTSSLFSGDCHRRGRGGGESAAGTPDGTTSGLGEVTILLLGKPVSSSPLRREASSREPFRVLQLLNNPVNSGNLITRKALVFANTQVCVEWDVVMRRVCHWVPTVRPCAVLPGVCPAGGNVLLIPCLTNDPEKL